MDRFFTALYRRSGGRYLDVFLGMLAISILLVVVPTYSTLLFTFFDATGREYVEVVLIFEPFLALAGLVALVILRRRHAPLLDWIRGHHSAETAPAAWESAVLVFPRTILVLVCSYALWAIPAAWLVTQTVDMSLVAGLLYGVFLALLGMGVAVFGFLYVEQALRPVVQEMAPYLPLRFTHRPSQVSLGFKLLVLVPAINLYTGTIVAAVSANDLGLEGRLAVAIGSALLVSATVSLLLSMMFRRSLLSRLEDVRTVVSRVEAGDLDATVTRLASDELDEVGQSVNEMVEGLREREALRSENDELLEEVRASRARIIAASDAERRRVERNIHDGAQQRLVALALQVRLLEEQAETDPTLRGGLEKVGEELKGTLGELRELARGLHPSVLSTDGLRPALEQLANRAPVPVNVSAPDERFPEAVESTAYFVASEALANVAKYAEASSAEVSVARRNGRLHVDISDNGRGGADPASGSGLAGLTDRVAALDGRLTVDSPPGAGTKVSVELPLSQVQG